MAGEGESRLTALAVRPFLESLTLAYWEFGAAEYAVCSGIV